MKLLNFSDVAICLTAAGLLFHQGKVLLVKHKKLQIWLAPGGHIEPNELPHQAAEREFWEETGIKVTALPPTVPFPGDKISEYVPNPILSNLHWISHSNYLQRKEGKESTQKGRRCEQHVCFIYMMKPVAGISFTQNKEETDGIGWFLPAEVQTLETTPDIKFEIDYCSKLV